MKIQKKLNNQ